MTQWAIAQDAPDFVKALGLQVTASNFRDAIVYPGGSFALEMALTWLHQIEHQELGWRTVLRAQLRSARVLAAAADVLPLGKCDVAAIGEPVALLPGLARAQHPRGPVVGRHRLRAPAGQGAAGQPGRRVVRPLPAGPGGRLRGPARAPAARPASPSARGPTPAPACSPRRSATAPSGSTSSSVSGRGREPRAPVRVFVMGSRTWQEFSLWPPAGEAQQWYLGRWGTLGTDAAGRERAPTATTTTRTTRRPPSAGRRSTSRTAGRKDQRRREHRHDVLTYTSPVLSEDLTVIGPLTATLYVRSSLEHTDFFVRLCDVSEKGRSVNLSDGIVRLAPGLGATRRTTASSGSTSRCGRPPTRSGPATGSGSRSRAAPTRSSAATPAPASRWPRAPPCARPTRRSSTTPPARRRITLPVVRLLADEPLGERRNGFAGPPRLASRA